MVSDAGDVNGDGLPDFIIGAPDEDPDGREDAGETYVVFGTEENDLVSIGDVRAGEGGFVIRGADPGDRAGSSVSGAGGDVNADGLDDIIVGAPGADPDGRVDAGVVYVVFGTASGTSVELASIAAGDGGLALRGARAGDRSGYSVSDAGDVNADGTPDLLLGAPYADTDDEEDAGASFVVFGSSNGQRLDLLDVESGSGGFVVRGGRAGEHSGWSVSGAGDVNGDGMSDLIVGAPDFERGQVPIGRAYVVFGKPGGSPVELPAVAGGEGGFAMRGASSYREFGDGEGGSVGYCAGFSVSGAGDVNGDGLSDVIVGAPYAGEDGDWFGSYGSAFVVFGKADGGLVDLATDVFDGKGLELTGPTGYREEFWESARAGFSVSGAGDINGDGLADMLVGAPGTTGWWNDFSASFIVFGQADSGSIHLDRITDGENGYTIRARALGDSSGSSVSSGGTSSGTARVIIGDGHGGASYVVAFSRVSDCNANGIPDSEDLAQGTSEDCDGDGLLDECVLAPLLHRARLAGGLARLAPRESMTARIEYSVRTPPCYLEFGAQLVIGLGDRVLECLDVSGGAHGSVEITLDAPDEAGRHTLWAVYENEGSCAAAAALYSEERATNARLRESSRGLRIGTIHAVAMPASDGFAIFGPAGSQAGGSVSGAGDVNGDGHPDVIVGGRLTDYVVFGKSDREPVQLEEVADGRGGFAIHRETAVDVLSGSRVAGGGDVNGDGLDDVIVGAESRLPNGQGAVGRSYVVFGKRDGAAVDVADIESGLGGFAIRGQGRSARSGTRVFMAGDVNGDGLADIVVGPGRSYLGSNDVHVVLGKRDTSPVELDEIHAGRGGGFAIPSSSWMTLSAAGDVNGDGLDDLVLGWPEASAQVRGQRVEERGEVFVVFGKRGSSAVVLRELYAGRGGFVVEGSDAISCRMVWVEVCVPSDNDEEGPLCWDENREVCTGKGSGWVVSGVGDVNGDGLADIAIGARRSSEIAIVFGKRTSRAVHLAEVSAGRGGFEIDVPDTGAGVSGVGDVDGDGLGDFVIARSNGTVVVAFGKRDTARVPYADIESGERGLVFRSVVGESFRSARGAGDVNDDGLADLIVGAGHSDTSHVVIPSSRDCNGNGVADGEDIAAGTSEDCDGNGAPDECQPDCDEDGTPNACEISHGDSPDCNENGVPDACEADCDSDGVPDDCSISGGLSEDCNGNGVPDTCEIASGASEDCDENGVPDSCEADCDEDGIPDRCEIESGSSTDCDANGVPDDCEVPVLFAATLVGGTIRANTGAQVHAELEFSIASVACRRDESVQLVLGLAGDALQCVHDGVAPGERGEEHGVRIALQAPNEPGRYTLYMVYEEEESCAEALELYSIDRARNGVASGQRRGRSIGSIVVSEPPPSDPVFRRGDANGDGTVDLSDAVATLGVLFLGQGALGCEDAVDANDDGAVDLSDPVATLGVLFLGHGGLPVPGISDCGADPTEDSIECEDEGACF